MSLRKVLLFLATALLAAIMTAPLPAATLWTLDNVTFDDSTIATGSFVYDAGTGEYSDWNIQVQAASFMPAYNYLPGVDGGFEGIHTSTQVDFGAFPTPPPPSGRYIRLFFVSPLTDAGGAVLLTTDGSAWECDNCSNQRFITGGEVTGVPLQGAVPEPASWSLLSGAIALGALYRRKRR